MSAGHFIAACPCGCRYSARVTVLRELPRARQCVAQVDGTPVRWAVKTHALVWVRSAA